jgi:hypothetical protein
MAGLEAWFDRRVSEALLDALRDRNGLGILIAQRDSNPLRFDVLLRGNQKTLASTASLYVGLTKILDVHEKDRLFKLRAYPTYSSLQQFDPAWKMPRPLPCFAPFGPAIAAYLLEADRMVANRYLTNEGIVQGLLCSGLSAAFTVISREAAPTFINRPTEVRWTEEVAAPLQRSIEAVGSTDDWWPGVRDHGVFPAFGREVDVLAVSSEGNLYVIEAKPSSATKGLVWGLAQVRFYAEMFARIIHTDPGAITKLSDMLAQRRSLKLSASNGIELKPKPKVVPVLAIGAGKTSREIKRRIATVASALPRAGQLNPIVSPPQLWQLNSVGDVERIWIGKDLEAFGEAAPL